MIFSLYFYEENILYNYFIIFLLEKKIRTALQRGNLANIGNYLVVFLIFFACIEFIFQLFYL